MKKLYCIAALCAALCFTTACGLQDTAPEAEGTAVLGKTEAGIPGADGAAVPGTDGAAIPSTPAGTDAEAPDALRLSMTQEKWSVTDPEITYTVINETGETQEVVFIPHLEKQEGDQWEELVCASVFCGTPDSVESQLSGSIPAEWYPGLTAGTYRLSLHVGSSDSGHTISAQFTLE